MDKCSVTDFPAKSSFACPFESDHTLNSSSRDEWDYCCRPGSQCGYSERSSFPWCYVGAAGNDQWRPCDPSMVQTEVQSDRTRTFFHPATQKAARRSSKAGDVLQDHETVLSYLNRTLLYDSEPEQSQMAPDLVKSSVTTHTFNSENGFDNSLDNSPVKFDPPLPVKSKPTSLSPKTTAIKFGF